MQTVEHPKAGPGAMPPPVPRASAPSDDDLQLLLHWTPDFEEQRRTSIAAIGTAVFHLLLIIALAMIVGIMIFYPRMQGPRWLERISLGLLLGGVLATGALLLRRRLRADGTSPKRTRELPLRRAFARDPRTMAVAILFTVHELKVAYAIANGIFGSIDANRGDYQNAWDTDQFPNSVDELSLAMYEIVRSGGFSTGGFNFDAKLRRQRLARTDRLHGHIGGVETLARTLLVAADMLEHGTLERYRTERYKDWSGDLGRAILAGSESLDDLGRRVAAGEIDPRPVSGGQEYLENLVNQRIWAADRVGSVPELVR